VNVLDRLRATHDEERSGYEAARVSESLADHLAGTVDRNAVTVRPDKDNGGIEAMDEVLEALHTVETTSPALRSETQNVSPAHAFEMRYAAPDPASERVVTLQYVPGSDGLAGTLRRQLQGQYPDSHVDTTTADLLPAVGPRADRDRDGDSERYVAGATLTLRRYTLYPIKNVDLPGFRSDPTGSVLEEMVGAQEDADTGADVAVQIMFKPARRTWTQGVPEGHGTADAGDERITGAPGIRDLSYNLTQPTYEKSPLPAGTIPGLGWIPKVGYEVLEQPPTKVDKQVATLLEEQQGEKGWRLCLRVLAVSADPEVAVDRAAKTAGMFRNFYESNTEQTFVPEPLTGDALADAVERAGRREFHEQGIVKAQREVAGLVNVPAAEHVTTNKLRWSMSKPGEGIPPGTPRFDFDGHGVPADASTEERQVALLDAAEAEAPYWYGIGARHGIEAGIDVAGITNPHKFVHGESGTGKTTFLAGDIAQDLARPGGGLRLDPTGDDVDDWLAEWPADRPAEDLIYMDLSGDFDRIPRFNFLEIPDYLEPGTREFVEFLEALAEDILEMVGVAGGSDNYVGGLMKRIVKTVVRAMGKFDEPATLYDVAVVSSASENLERLANRLSAERYEELTHLRDRIQQLAEHEDKNLDALAGRLDEWVLNDNVRELICARDPTFSVQDAVEQGTEIFVRFSDSGSDTVKHMIGNALITRTYFAQRHHRPDAPFSLTVDEAQSIITSASDIETIMDQGRKFNYRVTVACQRPASQLPDGVREAILGNARTVISYAAGRTAEAKAVVDQHDGIDASDLVNLGPFTFYVSTEDADRNPTHSYKVNAFRAPSSAREMIGDPAPTDTEALKERSLETYGVTAAAVDDGRSILDEPLPGADPGAGVSEELTVTDAVERAVVQGVYDTACRAGDPSGSVPLGDCRAAIIRRVARLDATPDRATLDDDLAADGDLWRQLIQHVPDDLLEIRERDGAPALRATSPRATLATVGGDQSAGGAGHGLLMWAAYAPLTWAGLDVEILDASGDDPDALVRPAPPAEQHAPALVKRLTGGDVARLEAEHSTGRSKPGMTAQHVLQAATEGRQAVVLARPGDAANVADTLRAAPAYCRSDHPVDGEVRYYTSPRDVRIGGAVMTRPGGRANAWVKDEATGEVVLRDGSGTEYARFEDAGAVFTDAGSYPPEGDRTVKQPIIPEIILDEGAVDPHVEILEVPEGADELADLSLRIGTDMTVSADAVGSEDRDAVDHSAGGGEEIPAPDDLDVPATVARFYDHFQDVAEADGGVSVKEAQDLAAASGDPKLDVSRRAMQDWLSALVDQGALRREDGDHAADPTTYHPR